MSKMKVPVVRGEDWKQILVVSDITLPEPAIKLDKTTKEIRDLRAHICTGKVIIQGTLHKEILDAAPVGGASR